MDAAQGVLDVVNTNMERALRHISVERVTTRAIFTGAIRRRWWPVDALAELARSLRIPRALRCRHRRRRFRRLRGSPPMSSKIKAGL